MDAYDPLYSEQPRCIQQLSSFNLITNGLSMRQSGLVPLAVRFYRDRISGNVFWFIVFTGLDKPGMGDDTRLTLLGRFPFPSTGYTPMSIWIVWRRPCSNWDMENRNYVQLCQSTRQVSRWTVLLHNLTLSLIHLEYTPDSKALPTRTLPWTPRDRLVYQGNAHQN